MKKAVLIISLILVLMLTFTSCNRVKIEIKEPEEKSIADGILFYPENVYEMDIEHFVNRENDAYISYLFRLVSSTGVQSVSNVPWHEYKGFSSGKELSSKQLLNFFFLVDEYSDNYIDEENKDYLIPVSDIHTVLDKYFSEYDLDIHDHSYNFEYLEDDTIIKSPGFTGIDFIYHAGYSIDSVVDNGDGTVKITVLINGTEMTENDEIIPNEEISEIHTMVIKPDKNSCKICSYEVEYLEEICSDAFEKWKELGYIKDFGEEKPITQEFILEAYSNYLLYANKDYDFFDRFVSAEELNSFSENYFGSHFLSLEADIMPDQIDEERGIKIYTKPQLYPSDTVYSFVSTGNDGENYYFEVKTECDYEDLAGFYSEKNVRVNFKYDDSKIYFIKQSSVYFDGVFSEFGDEMLLTKPWNDARDIGIESLVMWYGYRIQKNGDISKYMKGGADGLYIPEDEFESAVNEYFGLLPEHLRTSDTYNEAEKLYITPTALYEHAKTDYTVTKTEVDNGTVKIHFNLTIGDSAPEERILEVNTAKDKIKFISYQ